MAAGGVLQGNFPPDGGGKGGGRWRWLRLWREPRQSHGGKGGGGFPPYKLVPLSPARRGLKAIARYGAAALPHKKKSSARPLSLLCRGLTGGEDWGEFEGGGWKGLPPSKATGDCPENGGNLATPVRT